MAAALQFIIEEKYLAKYRVPALLGVGLEGMWGLLLSAIALPVLSIVKGPDGLAVDSLFSAFREIAHSWQLQVSPLFLSIKPFTDASASHNLLLCFTNHMHTDLSFSYVMLQHLGGLTAHTAHLARQLSPDMAEHCHIAFCAEFALSSRPCNFSCCMLESECQLKCTILCTVVIVCSCLPGVNSGQHRQHCLLQLLWLKRDQKSKWSCQSRH